MGTMKTTGEGFHHHKMILITGKVLDINPIPNGLLSEIVIEGFEDEKIYFYTGTLKNEDSLVSKTETFGMVDFFISKKLNEKAFKGDYGRGIMVFDMSTSNLDSNLKVSIQKVRVDPSEDGRMGGTTACSPCKFIKGKNEMIEYIVDEFSYFPMVTFADYENPAGNCYFSFFKCKTSGKNALIDAKLDYVFGLDDDPKIDPDVKVFVHEKLSN